MKIVGRVGADIIRPYSPRREISLLNEIKNQLIDYEIITITSQNFEQIFEVYDTNQDFFLLTQGKKATIESSISDIDALPPNCKINQKIYIGISKDGMAVGVLDLIEAYPEQTSFWIGLLLINASLHGKKIGSRLVEAIFAAAKVAGYKFAQLGVVENNIKGINFWQKHGFNILKHSGDIVIMERPVI